MFKFEELDGSSPASLAATEAARHNRLVCVAAGNEGNRTDYTHITVPGDADSVLTVASVNEHTSTENASTHEYLSATAIPGMIKNAEGKINGRITYARITIRKKK